LGAGENGFIRLFSAGLLPKVLPNPWPSIAVTQVLPKPVD